MQALCHCEVHREPCEQGLQDFLVSRGGRKAANQYAAQVVRTFWNQQGELDDRIAAAAANWDISRMSPVERNILRTAVVELCAGKVPPKVAINEAIEIGREFGGEDSPRFINGVLDAVLKRMHGAATGGI